MANRKHHKVLTFPPEVVEAVNKLMVKGVTYIRITAHLNELGYRITKSSVARYGKDFSAKLERVNIATAQAVAIIQEAGGDAAMKLEEAASIIALQKALTFLLETDISSAEKATEVMKSISRLQSSGVQREKLKIVLKEKVQQTAEKVKAIGKNKGLSPAIIRQIEKEVLGLVRA